MPAARRSGTIHPIPPVIRDVPGPVPLVPRRVHPNDAIGGLHRNAADAAFAEMLLNFEDYVDGRRHGEAVADYAEGLINGRH